MTTKNIIEDSILSGLADKIREKLGITDTMLPSAMPGKIGEVPAGGGNYAWKKSDSSGNFVDYVVSDDETEYPESGAGSDGYVYEMVKGDPWASITWADGTDEEIVSMVAAADAGEINLADYWSVGDTRTVSLSAMTASYVGESHSAQTVEFVLMHAGGYDLNSAVASGRTKCSFIVGMKSTLKAGGYMNSTDDNTGSWNSSARRSWCNNVFRNAIPSSIRGIFKQFKTITATNYNSNANTTSVDYFTLPAIKEIIGGDTATSAGYNTTGWSNLVEFNALFQYDWYVNTANIQKGNGYWTRSPYYGNTKRFCMINSTPDASYGTCSFEGGLSPVGVI